MRSRRHAALIAAVTSLVLVTASGCGGSEPASDAADPAKPGAKATGEAVVIGVVSQDTVSPVPSVADGITSWARSVNDNGGLQPGNRKVVLKRCDDKTDPAAHQACARKLIDDPSVMTVIGGNSRHAGAVGAPLYAKAKMPFICATPLTPGEYSAETGFCTSPGSSVEFAGLARQFVQDGAKKIAVIRVDADSGRSITDVVRSVAEANGATVSADIPLAMGATDALPAVTAAHQSKPDALIIATGPPQIVATLTAAKALNVTVPKGVSGAGLTEPVLALTDDAANLMSASGTPPTEDSDAEYQKFTKQIEKDFPNAAIPGAIRGWSAGRTFEAVAAAIGDKPLTRESVLDVLLTQELKDVPFAPPVMSRALAPEQFPAVAATGAYLMKVRKGEYTPVSPDPVFPFK